MTENLAPDVRLKLGYSAQREGRTDDAQAICRTLLKEFPDYVEALYLLGMLHIQKEEYGHALPCLEFGEGRVGEPARHGRRFHHHGLGR